MEKEYETILNEYESKMYFKQIPKEQEELFTWLPDSYQRLVCCP